MGAKAGTDHRLGCCIRVRPAGHQDQFGVAGFHREPDDGGIPQHPGIREMFEKEIAGRLNTVDDVAAAALWGLQRRSLTDGSEHPVVCRQHVAPAAGDRAWHPNATATSA